MTIKQRKKCVYRFAFWTAFLFVAVNLALDLRDSMYRSIQESTKPAYQKYEEYLMGKTKTTSSIYSVVLSKALQGLVVGCVGYTVGFLLGSMAISKAGMFCLNCGGPFVKLSKKVFSGKLLPNKCLDCGFEWKDNEIVIEEILARAKNSAPKTLFELQAFLGKNKKLDTHAEEFALKAVSYLAKAGRSDRDILKSLELTGLKAQNAKELVSRYHN
jgi:hypothetical protein